MSRRILVGLATACLLIPQTVNADDSPRLPNDRQDSLHRVVVQDVDINECSGIACSRQHANCLWMHNDSGDQPRLFRVGADGKTQQVCRILNAAAVDWEDMCAFEHNGQSWLLIADVGDNRTRRHRNLKPCTLYLLPEPAAGDAETEAAVVLPFEYEDGAHNCEGVAVDVEQQEILLLTKETPWSSAVYRLPLLLGSPDQPLVAERIARMPVTFATGLDLSPDGRRLVAVTLWDGWMCHRTADQTWKQALQNTLHQFIPPQRQQGEAVCFSADGQHLFFSSEKQHQPLWRVGLSAVTGLSDSTASKFSP